MHCSYCGFPLPARAPFCPNCGKPTLPASATNPASTPYNIPAQNTPTLNNEVPSFMNFGPLQETSSVTPDSMLPPSLAQPPYPPQQLQPLFPGQQPHMIFGASSPQVYPQQGTPSQEQPYRTGSQYPQYPQYPQQPQSTPFGPAQGNSQTGQAPLPGLYQQGYGLQSASMPQKRHKGLSTGVIVLLVILVIAIISGGGILLYATVLLPSSQHTQASTASTSKAKTPTAQATTSITTTNPQDLYTQVMKRTPTLNDPLTGQDTNNWLDIKTLQSCTFTGGELHLHGSAGSCIGESTSFGDFAYQVKMTIIQGNIGGITFRFDAINRKFYFFAINPTGVYAVVYVGGTSSSDEKLLASANSSSITPGLNQPNTLTVIARGSTMNIYINTQYITSFTDSSSSIGSIGMLGGNSSGSTSDVAFSDVQVWAL